MKRFLTWIIITMSLFVFVGCHSNSSEQEAGEESGKLVVTTTIAQIADGVRHIGGDKVEVMSLMGPGTDPHLFRAAQGDIEKLNKADLIFYNGLHLEGKMGDILEKMHEKKPTYAIAESIPQSMLLEDEDAAAALDPHIWFDVDLWKLALETVRDRLIEADRDNEDYYVERAEAYFQELDSLKEYAETELGKVAKESRVLVTAHDAFGYFGAAYQYEVIGLQGLSTDSEFGVADVNQLVDTLVERNIKAVFVESSVSERSLNAVIEGAKQKDHDVVIGGELFSDAMGEEGTETGTYIGMYKHNVDVISQALR